jgi:hypothetical protein
VHRLDRVRRTVALAFASVTLAAVSLVAVGSPLTSGAGGVAPALTVTPPSLTFGDVTLGDFAPLPFTMTNTNPTTSDTVTGYVHSGPDANDFLAVPSSNCQTDASGNVVLAAGASCTVDVGFFPGALGTRSDTLTLADSLASGASVAVSGTGTIGYYQVSAQGAIGYAGDAQFYGDASTTTLNHPIVGMAQTGDGGGYWLVASDGGIFNYGTSAQFYGSAGGLTLNKPIVGMAPHFGPTSTDGYWLVASDGGIFAYGDAQFYGSTGGTVLNKPIVGMAPSPTGKGYWLVASDGGVFAYGDAQFYGSTGALNLAQPIVGMAAMPDGHGYWFSAGDGGLFDYGSAPFYGSGAGLGLGQVVGMATDGAPTLQAFTNTPAVRSGVTQHWAAHGTEPLPGLRYAGRH